MSSRFPRLPVESLRRLTAGLGFLVFTVLASADEGVRLTLPPATFAVPGSEMSAYFANMVLADRDRQRELRFSVSCEVGTSNADRWTLTATDGQVGSYPLTVQVRDSNRHLLNEATTTVEVVPRQAGAGRDIRLLIVGDSLTNASQYPNDLARRLSQPGNPTWRMLGTHQPASAAENVFHEGYGGWTWNRFRTKFNPDAPEPGKQSSSPFVFADGLDVARYFAERCSGDKPDFIVVMLGINDCFHPNPDDPTAIEQRIEAMFAEAEPLLAEFRNAAPDAEIGICLTTPGNVRDEAFEANYKGRYTRWGWRRIQHRVVEREIEQFGNRKDEGIFLVPTQLNLDCEKGYPENNGVHPNSVGYSQIAATIHAWLKWRLSR